MTQPYFTSTGNSSTAATSGQRFAAEIVETAVVVEQRLWRVARLRELGEQVALGRRGIVVRLVRFLAAGRARRS